MRLYLAALLLASPGPVPAPGGPPSRAPADRPPWDLIWMVGQPEGAPTKPPPRLTEELKARGGSLYESQCAICHGERGDGRGSLADRVRPRPTDFTRGVYKLRSTPAGTLPTDVDLFRTLTRGVHGTAMRPWRPLPEEDRWALVLQLKSFSPRFRQEPPGRPIDVPRAPRETNDLRDRGEGLYVRLRCGACHGETGAGDGPAREALRQQGHDVRSRDFTRGRFIRGAEMEDIFVTLCVGIEGTPMAAYDTLADDELWALAAYVRLLVRERPLYQLPPAGTEARAVGDPRWRPGSPSRAGASASPTGFGKL